MILDFVKVESLTFVKITVVDVISFWGLTWSRLKKLSQKVENFDQFDFFV